MDFIKQGKNVVKIKINKQLYFSKIGFYVIIVYMATAFLSNDGTWTTFSFGEYNIRFMTSRHLEKYTQIKKWNNGYIIVMAKYDNADSDEEDYIDLIPILENLYIPAESFLSDIKEVRIKNEC